MPVEIFDDFPQPFSTVLKNVVRSTNRHVTHFWGWSRVQRLERKTHCSGSERGPFATCCSVDGWAMCKPNFPLQLPGDASIGPPSSKADSVPARRAPGPPAPVLKFLDPPLLLVNNVHVVLLVWLDLTWSSVFSLISCNWIFLWVPLFPKKKLWNKRLCPYPLLWRLSVFAW